MLGPGVKWMAAEKIVWSGFAVKPDMTRTAVYGAVACVVRSGGSGDSGGGGGDIGSGSGSERRDSPPPLRPPCPLC